MIKIQKKNKKDQNIFLEEDPIYKNVLSFAIQKGKISTSLIQRQFKIGYYRALGCMEELEKRGIVGSGDGLRPRTVLIKYEGSD